MPQMNRKAVRHRNIPIFIPHLGCPNLCVFCNQRSISGKQSFRVESVKLEIEAALDTIPSDCEVEIAYFGGSFTGIDRELMIYLLDIAKYYVDHPIPEKARVSGIRMSTRPDYINEEIMEILSHYPISAVELGLQSMDEGVLRLSKRGHTAMDAQAACKMIKDAGYSLVGQMMIGLPGSDLENEIYTANMICQMGADAARIYPTVTFFGTELACMAERGEYRPIELEDAVFRSKEVLKVFEAKRVECIRIGLCASDNLTDDEMVMGGANHPALGELVLGELYYDKMCRLLDSVDKEERSGKIATFCVPRGETSKAIGHGGRNKNRLIEVYGLKRVIVEERADTDKMILNLK